jgi:glycosyltransferase involved in cell wall biosynthesis
MAARNANVRRAVHTFYDPPEEPGETRDLSRSADRVVAVSGALGEDLLRRRMARPDRIRVVPPLVDPAPFRKGHGAGGFRRPPGIGADAPLLGMVGPLGPSADPDLFLRVFATVARSMPAARALVMGDGPERSAMEKRAKRLGLQSRVAFLGWTSKPAGLYSDLDLLLLTSRPTGCALAALEAMAAGTVVAGTRVMGVESLIEHGRTGLLADPGDAGGLAGAALLLLGDAKYRERLARNAREEAGRRFSRWSGHGRPGAGRLARVRRGRARVISSAPGPSGPVTSE